MTIFTREMRRNLRAWLIWTAVIALLVYYTLAFYPNIAQNSAEWDELLKQLPPQLSSAFNLDDLDMGDLLGWFGTEAFLMLLLFGTVYSAILGAGIISKEESDRTIEFLLSKPVSRFQIVSQKLAAGALYVLLLNAVVALVSFAGFEAYKVNDYSHQTAVYLFAGSLLVDLLFFSVAAALSTHVTKTKVILPMSIGIVIGTYFLNIMGELSEKAAFLRNFSPFRYSDAAEIIKRGALEPGYAFLTITLILLSVIGTYFFYNRKDMTA